MPEDRSYTDASDDEKEQPGPMLNYDQYYPTMLPMREPGMEEGFGAEELQAGARIPEFTNEQASLGCASKSILHVSAHEAGQGDGMQLVEP